MDDNAPQSEDDELKRREWVTQRSRTQNRSRSAREHLGGLETKHAPPPPREMPPLEVPATRRVTTRENMRLPDREGEVIFVSGRSRFADENGMPRVLKMKHKVKSSDLADDRTTISDAS